MAYVGATVRTEWNAAAGPQPQALSWAASGRGPRVCTSSRLHGGAELLVPASPSEPPGWEKAESLDFLAQPRCGAKRNFLKDYWDEKPGETSAGRRGRECPCCYLGVPALAKVSSPVQEEGVLRMTEGGWQRSWCLLTETHGAVGPKSWLSLQWPGRKYSHGDCRLHGPSDM